MKRLNELSISTRLYALFAALTIIIVVLAGVAVLSSRAQLALEKEVESALNQMDEVTQQNSALVEENASAAKSLEEQSAAMDERVSFFRVGARAPKSTVTPFKAVQPKQTTAARRPMPGRGNPTGRVQGALAAKIDDSWEEF
jgi:methyl-accepting chemotaxis protein